MSIYAGQTPRELYRSFFRHLRHLPDPHVWSILQPRFRHLLEKSDRARPPNPETKGDHGLLQSQSGSGDEPESSTKALIRAARARKNLEDELRGLQMAVSCYPHALRRLLAACYGRTGSVRWQIINVCRVLVISNRLVFADGGFQNVMTSSDPPLSTLGRPDLPGVLKPLAPPTPGEVFLSPRARTTIPDTAKRKALKDAWTRDWTGVLVPLIIPGSGTPKTGWEGKGVIESLRIMAQLEPVPATHPSERLPRLPSFDNLPTRLQRIYPLKLRPSPVPQYAPPPPRATRQNPKTWSNPRTFNGRKLRRAYQRLWNSLPWVTPVNLENGQWRTCTYEEMVDPSLLDSRGIKGKKRDSQSRGQTAKWPRGDESKESLL